MRTSVDAASPCGRPDQLTAVAIVGTRPSTALPEVERRMLAHFVEHLDRRIQSEAPSADGRAMTQRLLRLTAIAAQLPVANGVALLASRSESRLLHLRGFVRDSVHLASAATLQSLKLPAWPEGSLALVVITPPRSRVLVLERTILREVTDCGLPLRRHAGRFVTDHFANLDDVLAEALDDDLPMVLAGDEGLAHDFVRRSRMSHRVVNVLSGVPAAASPDILLGLALPRVSRPIVELHDPLAARTG